MAVEDQTGIASFDRQGVVLVFMCRTARHARKLAGAPDVLEPRSEVKIEIGS
jgi:hypothetical protein